MPYVVREKTGNSGTLTYNGVNVVFKLWKAKIAVNYADSTDSLNYDSVTGLTWRTQKAGDAGLEGSIEGYYDLNGHSAGMIAHILAATPLPAVFNLDPTTMFCSCLIDLMDFDTGVETDGANMIAFTTSFKSSGIPAFATPVFG